MMHLTDDGSELVAYDSNYPTFIRHNFLSTYPNYAAPSHWHNDVEFIVILNGKMNYNINGEIIVLSPGQGVFVNAGQFHFGYSEAYEECEFLCILIHPSILCGCNDAERDFIIPVVKNARLPYILLDDSAEWKKEITDNIRRIFNSRNDRASVMSTQGYFALIWALLYDNMPPYTTPEPLIDRDLDCFKNMISFIQHHYSEHITLAQIAKSGNIGQSKCCKLFGRYLTQTPNACLTEYRLNKSTEYLRNTDMTITEIALAVGFGGGSYFTETFKKWIDITPVEYRKMMMPKM